MRMIGLLDGEANAKTFSDYLYAEGIENQVEADKEGAWAVWIHAEEQLDRAKALLAGFRANPDAAKIQSSLKVARDLRDQKQKDQDAYEKRLKSRRHLFRPLRGYGFGPLTFVLICMCVVVFVLTELGKSMQAMRPLLISEDFASIAMSMMTRLTQGLPEIRHGEVWRLLTPMLVHFDIFHILFNMLWLRDLGSMIEDRQSSLTLGILVVVFAAISNLAQYVVSGPVFGGMSGVVYGLMGYIWIRGKRDTGSGLFLHPTTVTMMIVWLLLGFAGFMRMANTAHASGLLIGMIWGFLSSLRYR